MAAQKELSDQRSAESVLVKIHFLTDQEKETVVEVLQRNEKIRKHEADRKRRLQQELERLESSCAASQSPLAALTQSCPRCDAALALLVRGACDCFLCRLSVCKSCAHLFRDSQLCLCSVCYQKLLYESKIGNWMNLKSVMIAAESSVAAAAEDRTADSGDLLSGLMVKLSGTSTGADKDAAAGDESSVSVGMAATPPAPTPVRQWEQPAATYRVYQVSTRRFADSPPPRQVEKDDEEATGAADEAESEAEEEQELSIEERMRRHLEGSPDIVQRLWEHQAKCEASLTSSNDTKNESAAVEEETIVCVTSERAHSEMPKRNENYSSDDEVELDQQGGEVIPADADDLTLVDEQAGQISHPTDMSEATGSQLGEAGAFSSADQNLETSELSSELTLTTSAEQRPTVPVCGSIQLTNKDFDSTEFFSDQAESTEPFDAEADKTFAVRDRQKNFETSSEELNFTDAPVEVTVVGEHRKTQITSGNSDYLSDMLSQSKNTEDIIVGPADRESLAAGKDQKKTTVETSQETMEGDYEVSFQRESSVTLVQDSDDRAETTEQVSQNLVSYEIEQVSGSEGQPAVELLVVDEKQSLYPLTSAPNVGSTPGTAHSMFFDSFKKANPRQDAQENQTLLCLEGGPSKQLPDAEIHDKVEEVRVSQEPVIEFNPSDSAENLATLEQSDKFEVKANRSEPTEKILVSRQQTKSSKTLDPQDRPQPEAIDFDIKLGLLKRRPAAVESQTEAELCATEPPAEVTVVDANLRTRIPEISFREASGNSDELSNVLNQCENSEEVVRGPSNKQNLAKNNRNGAGATDALDSSLQAIQGDYERPVHRFASVALAEDQEERPEILDEISHHLVPSSEIEQVSVADWRLKIEDGDRDDESRLEQLASALSTRRYMETFTILTAQKKPIKKHLMMNTCTVWNAC
uniref:RabBD domain-containing protein n=1 Tax=Macrostomum lignano TaxID=282301 RepID=A0A1I8G9G4_9PLAT